MYNTPYNRWLWGSCCCESRTTPIGDCGDKEQCSCENILLEISNLHTTDNVISGEVDNKQDKLSAGTGIEITEDNVINCTANPDLSDYYTKEETDALIPEVPSLSGYATEQWVENQGYITGVDLSNYATLQDIPTVPTNVSAFINDAHYVSNSELVQYISNLQQQISSLIATVSGCCASTGETLYRWVTMTGENDYWCSGTTKMSMEKEQSSTDGLNWIDVSPETTRSGSTILETNCEECGYIPEHFKLLLTKNDDSNYIVYCNGDTEAKTSETHYGIDSTTIKEAVIGDCVTTLGVKLFSYCTSLSSVTIPSGVTYIDTGAFYNCPSLSAVTIPSGVTFIGQETFSGCTSLNSVNIPNGIEDVKANTFSYTNVENITIPDSINRILNKSFDHCANLKNVTIGTGCTIISMAFQYCTNLQNVTINATTPPMLLSSPFADTNDTFIIHVPAASLQTYKSASGWSAFADRIISI